MSRILAIDASSEACSVALLMENQVIERSRIAPRQHTELVLKMVEEVREEAGLTLKQLDAVAFNRGPGSFTGVRISTSVTQGLAYALDLPVIPVSGLNAVAQGAWRAHQQENILVLMDARMQEVYWACFQWHQGMMKLTGTELVSAISRIEINNEINWLAVGSGISVYNNELQALQGQENINFDAQLIYPQARDIADLAMFELNAGNAVSAMRAQPVYIRDKIV